MKIQVNCQGELLSLQASVGPRLLDYLQNAEIYVNAACGGAGTCHKCRVQITAGFAGISDCDRKAFTASELTRGWRLSCQLRPRTPLSLNAPSVENSKKTARLVKHKHPVTETLTLACDLGSTGIVMAIGNTQGQPLIEAHLLNKQVRFGADVMTRLAAAQRLSTKPLTESLHDSLRECLRALFEDAPDLFEKAAQGGVFCAGNSAMLSFLHGWDITSLAVSPFQPARRTTDQSVLDGNDKFPGSLPLYSLPLLGGFVGGDTVAALLSLKEQKVTGPWMLVDIGTNTEIVLHTGKGELWFASAPAGPAFEGGNISSGMRAEPGAIGEAHYKNKTWAITTIGDDKPRGICGSGLMDILHESVRAGLITEDGYLEGGRLDVTEEISLVADDIREFQLAKSATRTACDLLIDRANVQPRTLYLAGAFAEHLRLDSIAGIGLLPANVAIEQVGNASLKGTLLYARMSEKERIAWIEELETARRPVELALQDDFQAAFVRNLNFVPLITKDLS